MEQEKPAMIIRKICFIYKNTKKTFQNYQMKNEISSKFTFINKQQIKKNINKEVLALPCYYLKKLCVGDIIHRKTSFLFLKYCFFLAWSGIWFHVCFYLCFPIKGGKIG